MQKGDVWDPSYEISSVCDFLKRWFCTKENKKISDSKRDFFFFSGKEKLKTQRKESSK